MEELKACPLCGEPLTVRKSIVGGEEHYVAYCHCGFEFADDCSIEDFIERCNRRAAPENKPLASEELRRMDGERVWDDYNQDYALVWSRGNEVTLRFKAGGVANAEVGINRKIYARKPEGSAP